MGFCALWTLVYLLYDREIMIPVGFRIQIIYFLQHVLVLVNIVGLEEDD